MAGNSSIYRLAKFLKLGRLRKISRYANPWKRRARIADELAAVQAGLGRLDNQVASLNDGRLCDLLSKVATRITKRRSAVFVSRGFFGDNVKYAFLAFCRLAARHGFADFVYLASNAAEQRLLEQAGYPVKLWSRADHDLLDMLLHAAVAVKCEHFAASTFADPLPMALLSGSRTLQLWHGGVGLKRIGLDNVRSFELPSMEVLDDCLRTDVLLLRSQRVTEVMKRSFQPGAVIVEGLPRWDVFMREPDAADLLNIDTHAFAKMRRAHNDGQRIIVYAPTFRDANPNWLMSVDLAALARAAERHRALLVIQLHPYEQPLIGRITAALDGAGETAVVVRPGSDIYPLLPLVDVLVTDYSSICADFLLLDRPVVFFQPDYDPYIGQSRQLYLGEHTFPGPVVATMAELLARLFGGEWQDAELWQQHRQHANAWVNEKADGGAADRIAEHVWRMMAPSGG